MENKECVDCKDKLVRAVEGNEVFTSIIYTPCILREYIRYNRNVTVH
jgi:hypothetical protein